MKNILLMKYIHLFKTNSEFTTAYNGPDYIEPWLSLTEETMTIGSNKPKLTDFSAEPLTFNILSAGTINWKARSTSITKTIDYKLNDGEWTSITSNTGSSAPTITVNSGDKLQFRGNNEQYCTGVSSYNSFGDSTALFEVEGNIMSLIYGDDFKNNLTISSDYTFANLFKDCTKLVSAENLILPATTLTSTCYASMFQGCTSLTTAPALPATTLASTCYDYMFGSCKNLTTAPELPATTLASKCYSSMFEGCTSLTTAPELPATKLESSCYQSMFQGCTSLTTAPALPATTLASSCYNVMFRNCTSLTTAPELPATTLASKCYSNMFKGCKKLTAAPELPATKVASDCYFEMFNGCTALTTAPSVLPATNLATSYGCYNSMFKGCTSLTTAPELPATKLESSCYTRMFEGCTSLNYIKCLATNISAYNCTGNWVSGVASTGTFVKASSMKSWTRDVNGIPANWTVQNA